eukprot:CAMPEP_0185614324 /NCGR_PEP_ID=MMETSP0436-20130131/31161_1 /TAXON_ID=626734 ORGANISM="Favella taraikaensis, Strain Fe Narragansett Bay" /NCGR_SAMPLE_ID=MMETSP0436 /ASSEMBLY_ACC=CAM_ASM_000390 /LENGTH=64 /DNA_ID=CAMNT_0028249047 /DNA_START=220 /DNA_END=414 /DNA_ORIENTATION=-
MIPPTSLENSNCLAPAIMRLSIDPAFWACLKALFESAEVDMAKEYCVYQSYGETAPIFLPGDSI